MTMDTWLLYVGLVLVFMCTPGPSHLLMVSVSMSFGFRRSVATAAGDLSANAIQMLLAGFGLAAVIKSSSYGFTLVKWAGVVYLIFLGVRQIIGTLGGHGSSSESRSTPISHLWLRGFITSASNPKAIVFFAALFPQFLESGSPLYIQLVLLGGTYIVIDACFLAAYGLGAGWVGKRTQVRQKVWLERAAGSSLIAAAVLLGTRAVVEES